MVDQYTQLNVVKLGDSVVSRLDLKEWFSCWGFDEKVNITPIYVLQILGYSQKMVSLA